MVTIGEAKMADPPVAMATGGRGARSPLELDKLYQNMKKYFKNSIGLLKYLKFSIIFSISRNRNFIFQSLITL